MLIAGAGVHTALLLVVIDLVLTLCAVWASHLRAAGAGGRRAAGATLDRDARVVCVSVSSRRLVEDGLGQLREGAVDVDVGLRRCLHEADAVLARYLFTSEFVFQYQARHQKTYSLIHKHF